MIGIAYLAAAIVYLLIMIAVVSSAWKRGRKTSRKRAFGYAVLGFLAVYLPLFWDHLPTLVMHQYYCAKDAGVTIYKTPEQWIKVHESELDKLRLDDMKERITATYTSDGWTRRMLNREVSFDTRNYDVKFGWIYISGGEARYYDVNRNMILASRKSYSSGRGHFESDDLRLWMNFGGCKLNNESNDTAFYAISDKYLLGVKE